MPGMHQDIELQARLFQCHRLAQLDAPHVGGHQHRALAAAHALQQGLVAFKADVLAAIAPGHGQRLVENHLGKDQEVLQALAPARRRAQRAVAGLQPLQIFEGRSARHAARGPVVNDHGIEAQQKRPAAQPAVHLV
ncbi:hypothetical protein D3C85_1289740 [compost metagenome]